MCTCVPLSIYLSFSLSLSPPPSPPPTPPLSFSLSLARALSLSLLHTTVTQLKVLGDVTEDDPYVNPIDEEYEAGMIRDLNDKWDNKVNPFQ
jgi:hypothetical protein